MFLLLALACRLAARSMWAATLIILLAFMMKMFPAAGLLLLLREPPRRAWLFGLLAAAGAAIYLVLIREDLPKIWAATEKGADISYGYNVLSLYLQSRGLAAATVARPLAFLALAAGGATVWWRLGRNRAADPAPSPALDGYRIGAGVYAGTFLLGNSWDYRMIFLFFMLPQLFAWWRGGRQSERVLAASQLLAILIATWAMWLTRSFPNAFWRVRTLEELAKWWLFFSSLHLLAHTLPGWARAWLRFDFKAAAGPEAAAPAR
jgi:hypothetical protein